MQPVHPEKLLILSLNWGGLYQRYSPHFYGNRVIFSCNPSFHLCSCPLPFSFSLWYIPMQSAKTVEGLAESPLCL